MRIRINVPNTFLQLKVQYYVKDLDFHTFVLSNGDTTGVSMHGDFISGFREAALQEAMLNCNFGTPDGKGTKCFHATKCPEANEDVVIDVMWHPFESTN